MRQLRELLDGLVDAEMLRACGTRTVASLCDDSRRAGPGALFVAVPGSVVDGRQFIGDAVQRGAAVVVGQELGAVPGALAIRVDDARATLARLAHRWYGLDAGSAPRLKLIGITGTNGKSTTAFMVRGIFQAAGQRCGLLGTLHYDLCARSVKSNLTTPGTLELASYLRECADSGAEAAVMEVSSHALDQRRTAGLHFAAAAFTNLTQDHLDYHGTLENYRAAKARLFAELAPEAVAVINRDDPHHAAITADCRARLVYYSLEGDADITGKVVRDTVQGTLYRMRIGGRTLALENAIVGQHNVYNALAAAGLAWALGVPLEAIEAGLTAVRNIPGRLQRVPSQGGPEVFVDYAHTDDALRNVLRVLKPLTRRRLIAVFGCGGDRDRGKRPKMARAVAEFADAIVVTSDNPRTEDPKQIITDILAGFDEQDRRRVSVEPDRRAAIVSALAGAGPGDVVLIAGKGHEDYQIIGTQRVHFDDVEVAIEAAAELARQRPGGPAAENVETR
jgi:UDP-N-acetylmuramoyl-L-alanyl-D-glutamate--2,6-diaminopimelate ligase